MRYYRLQARKVSSFNKPRKILGTRGNIQDLALFMVAIVALGLIAIIVNDIAKDYNDNVQSNPVINPEGKSVLNNTVNPMTSLYDNSIPFLVFGMLGGILTLAALIRAFPFFLPVGILFVIFMVFVAAILSNMVIEITSGDQIADTADDYTQTTFIWENLPLFIIGGLLIIGLALYGKTRLST